MEVQGALWAKSCVLGLPSPRQPVSSLANVKGEAHPVFAAAGWRGGRWHTQALCTEENHR